MNTKSVPAIAELRLDRASFSGARVDGLSGVNFFYGGNGVGKSTIARCIAENNGTVWAAGRSAGDYEILLFDRDFTDRNFSDCGSIPGVFIVNETNVAVQKEIEEKSEARRLLEEERGAALAQWREMQEAPEKIKTEFQEDCWKNTAAVRAEFKDALGGSKTKKSLAAAILNEAAPQNHNLSELKRLYSVAFDNSARLYPEFSKADSSPVYGRLPGKDLLNNVIISSGDSAFARFMNALGASDWVREGHTHFSGDAEGVCPYCQQRLPDSFEKDIADCFDADYRRDISDLRRFRNAYSDETSGIVKRLRDNMGDVMPSIDLGAYKARLELLESRIDANLRRLDEKLREPAKPAALDDTDSLLLEIGGLIDDINERIRANNKVVSEKRKSMADCKKMLMEHLAFISDGDIKKRNDNLEKARLETLEIENRGKAIRREISEINAEIAELNSKSVSTETAVAEINRLLAEADFRGFSILAENGAKGAYRVIREDGSTAKNLSEGERNFIAFLYFCQTARGSMSEGAVRDKIVVIDDPSTGMDDQTAFIVSTVIRDMAEQCRDGGTVRQLFLLTHSARFYDRVTFRQTGDDTSFYIIKKENGVSEVELCVRDGEKSSPVRSSYAALWDELREARSAVPIINVMRRIISEYFVRTCGYDMAELRKAVSGADDEEHRTAAKLLGFADGDGYIEEFADTEECKRAFRLIFEESGQKRHYNMMAGGNYYDK